MKVARIAGALSTVGLLAAGAFGADAGRIRVADAELAVVAEAAAEGARAYLDGTVAGAELARRRAASIAAANQVDGQPVVLGADDVELGFVHDDAFVPRHDVDVDAVRVTVHRSVPTWSPATWLGADRRTATSVASPSTSTLATR